MTIEQDDQIPDGLKAALLAMQAYDQATLTIVLSLAHHLGGADVGDLQKLHVKTRRELLESILRKWEDRNPALSARLQSHHRQRR